MQVTVKLFAEFRRGRFISRTGDYPPNTSVARVLEELELPEKEVGIALVNGRHADTDGTLKDGDTLSLFPLIGGG